MAVLGALLALALLGSGCSEQLFRPRAAAPTGFVSATVDRVVDGDTAVFEVKNVGLEKVRFIGVDTPESTTQHEPFGEEAAAYTRGVLSEGREVYLEFDQGQRDRYGRLLAYVWLEAPAATSDAETRAKMLNAKLALDGYAQQMTISPNVKYADRFRTYAAEAREARRGLWAESAPK
ncbi:MAG: thermonuclease family protein [Coriobacteriia bacterium]|nr:thermonuclease family protein [Coriobacteriia bacterium]